MKQTKEWNLISKAQAMAQTVGLAAMIVCMHNFVWEYPALFEQLFSSEWVATVQSETQPASIYFRGVSFTL